MNKRVYGIIGISSVMSNWNADFSGYPKTISNGRTFGSDKALKYPMKKMWENEGKKVLYIKSMDFGKNNEGLIPRSLSERYAFLFGEQGKGDEKNTKKILENLMLAVDVKNFGATYAEKGNNIAITGAVQIGQGFNEYDDTEPQVQQILSPFRDGSKDSDIDGEAKNSTLGTKIVSDEAHYFYPFVINPMAYKELIELGVTNGYTQEDYDNFKRTALVCATSYATNSKEGCENEFALFVETEPDVYLPNLSTYLTFEKGKSKNIISLSCDRLFDSLTNRIISVEVYYNPYTTELKQNINQAKIFDIVTQKEV